jgi:hypothetical protein
MFVINSNDKGLLAEIDLLGVYCGELDRCFLLPRFRSSPASRFSASG